jgi:hypothetical protein
VFQPFHAKLIFKIGSVESIIKLESELSSLELVTLSTAINFVKTCEEVILGRVHEYIQSFDSLVDI